MRFIIAATSVGFRVRAQPSRNNVARLFPGDYSCERLRELKTLAGSAGGQAEDELRALPRFARGFDRLLVCLHHRPHQAQPQSKTPLRATAPAAVEPVPDPR